MPGLGVGTVGTPRLPVPQLQPISRRDDFLEIVIPRRADQRFVIDGAIAVGFSPDGGIRDSIVKLTIKAPDTYAIFALNDNGFIKPVQQEPSKERPEVWDFSKLDEAGPLVILSLFTIVRNSAGISVRTRDINTIIPEEFLSDPLPPGGLTKALRYDEFIGIFEPDPDAVIRYSP